MAEQLKKTPELASIFTSAPHEKALLRWVQFQDNRINNWLFTKGYHETAPFGAVSYWDDVWVEPESPHYSGANHLRWDWPVDNAVPPKVVRVAI